MAVAGSNARAAAQVPEKPLVVLRRCDTGRYRCPPHAAVVAITWPRNTARRELRVRPSTRRLIERATAVSGLAAGDLAYEGARRVLEEHDRMTLRGADRDHDRLTFTCGVPALDDWFRARAGQDQRRRVAQVFVAIDEVGIPGFYSLGMFRLALDSIPVETARSCLVAMRFPRP